MTFELTPDAWFCRQLGLLPTTTKCLMLKFQLKCRPFRLNTHISILSRAANDPLVFTIMEKATTLLKAPISAFTFTKLLRHYAN